MDVKRIYEYQGKRYEATITFKRMKSLVMRMGAEEGTLRISAPNRTPLREIDKFVESHLDGLLKKVEKRNRVLGRTYRLEQDMAVAKHDIESLKGKAD